jgi:hypothetical protein
MNGEAGSILHITNQQIFDPLLANPPQLKNYEFSSPTNPLFLKCEKHAITSCYRRFGTSSRSLSECIYGHMVASQILPPEIIALADEAKIDTGGSFLFGASMVCRLPNMGNADGYPAMVDYY